MLIPVRASTFDLVAARGVLSFCQGRGEVVRLSREHQLPHRPLNLHAFAQQLAERCERVGMRTRCHGGKVYCVGVQWPRELILYPREASHNTRYLALDISPRAE